MKVKVFIITLLVLFSLFFALLLLPATQWGSKQIVNLINKHPSVNLNYRQGSFIGAIDFSQADFTLANTSITLHDLLLSVDISCLTQGKVCIDKIKLSDLQVDVQGTANNQDTTEPTKELAVIEIPIGINISSIYIDKASVKLQDNLIQLNKFTTAIAIVNSRVTFNKPNIDSLVLQLAKQSENNKQTVTKTPTVVSTPPELPVIYSPLQIELRHFLLKELIVDNQANTVSSTQEATNAKSDSSDNINEANGIYTLHDTRLDLTWFEENFRLHNLSSQVQKSAALLVSGTAQFKPPYALDIEIESQLNSFTLYPQIAKSTQLSTLQGNLKDLTVEIKSSGNLAFDLQANANVLDSQLPYSLVVNAQALPLPKNINPTLQSSALQLKTEGNLKAQQIDLSAKVNGFGYQDAKISLLAKTTPKSINIETFTLNSPISKSELALKGDVSLHQNDIVHWDLLANTSGFTLPKLAKEYATGRLTGAIKSQGKWGNDAWFVSLKNTQLTGVINNKPFSLMGELALDNSLKMQPSHVDLSYGDATIKVQGYTDSQWHVNAAINIPKLDEWSQQTSGQVETSLTISGPFKNPIVDFQSEANALQLSELFAPQLAIKGSYLPNENHKMNALLTSNKVIVNDIALEQLNANLQATEQKQSFALQWQGESTADINIAGDWFTDSATWQGQLLQAAFSLHNNEISLQAPLALSIDTQRKLMELSRFCFDGNRIKLCMNEKTQLGETGKVTLSLLTNLAKIDDLLLPNNAHRQAALAGELRGKLQLAWLDLKKPSAIANIDLAAGQFTLQEESQNITLIQWQKSQLNMSFVNGELSTDLTLFESKTSPFIDVKLQLKADDSLSGFVNIDELNLKPFIFFVPELTEFDGMLNSDIQLKGTRFKPQIFGKASLNQVQLETLRTTTKIDDLTVNVDFTGSGVSLNGKALSADGELNMLGTANWENRLAFDLALDSEKFHVTLPDRIEATLAPHLKINLTDNTVKLFGDINVLAGSLSVDDLPQSSVTVSKDVVIIDDDGTQVVNDSTYNIETDINVYISDLFKISGQGFAGRIGGNLNLTQKMNQPVQLFGSLKIPEGKYNSYGQKLEVDKATISFNGPINNPLIDLRAIRKITAEDVVVGIELSGQAKALQMDFYSSPTMNQSDIASYLVRGKALDSSASGGGSMVTGIGTSLVSATGVLEQLEKIPLLNNIEIEASDEQATISGYVSDRVYIKYGIGLIEPINELTIRLYWLNRFWLESVTGLENSANIYYSFEID